MRYRRVLLKVSGDLFSRGKDGDLEAGRVATEVADLQKEGVSFAVVTGGGNVIRGMEAKGIGRETADYIGMLATVINALIFRDLLEEKGTMAALFSSLPVQGLIPAYSRHEALEAMGRGEVVLLAGGTGNPYFSTDTAAALRALELGCEVLLKGTKVDGVYEADPEKVPGAKRFDRLGYEEVLARGLQVMDASAVLLCEQHRLPIVVFDLLKAGQLRRILEGEAVGTTIS